MPVALIVVDAQKVYTDKKSPLFSKQCDKTIDAINKLIAEFRRLEALIVMVRHIHKPDGTDLGRMFDFTGEWDGTFNFKAGDPEVEYDDKLTVPKNYVEVVKARYSSFTGTNLLNELRKRKIDRVVICGFMTNFCCESTARDAHDLDFFVDFIIDATGTPGTENMNQEQIRKAVSEFMSAGFANVYTTSEYLKKLKVLTKASSA